MCFTGGDYVPRLRIRLPGFESDVKVLVAAATTIAAIARQASDTAGV
jgi:hypothetical protein